MTGEGTLVCCVGAGLVPARLFDIGAGQRAIRESPLRGRGHRRGWRPRQPACRTRAQVCLMPPACADLIRSLSGAARGSPTGSSLLLGNNANIDTKCTPGFRVGCIFGGRGVSRFLVEKLFSCDKLTTSIDSIDYNMGVSDEKTVF